MIEIEVKTEKNYPYAEVNESWKPIVFSMVDEIEKLLDVYALPLDAIVFEQIKEKNGLRVYYSIPMQLEELTDEQELFFHTIAGIVEVIIQKYERLVKYKIKKGEL